MNISINGDSFEINSGVSLHQVLEERCFIKKTGIAVALNNIVVPQAQWSTVLLNANDCILVITATKGG